MNKKIILLLTLCLTFILGINTLRVDAQNGVPYYTFTEDSQHDLTYTQDAYIPVAILTEFQDYQLRNPEDIFIDSKDIIYIADTGHAQIVIIKDNMETVYSIGKGTLSNPTGVFVKYVDDKAEIYVADSKKEAVFKFDADGNVLQTFTRPDHPLFGEESSFQPDKVTVDNRGNLYIVDKSNKNGIIQLSKYGEFYNYFGINYSRPSLNQMLIFMFGTKKQKESSKTISLPPSNITLNKAGLITAYSNDQANGVIQSFDIEGNNILGYARTNFTSLVNTEDEVKLNDITIGPLGNIYVVNSLGFVAEYDEEGNLLFVFGGKDLSGQIKGLVNTPTGLAVDNHFNLYLLDSYNGSLHVYQPTDFANLVHEALGYYQEGFYVKSQGPWQEVLKRNALFDLAHRGLGNAYLKKQLYEEALQEFKIADDKEGYSDSFWEIRNLWLQNNLKYIIVILFVLIVDFLALQSYLVHSLGKLIRKLFKPLNRFMLWRELTFISYFIKHPLDGYYGIKRENKTSVLSASIFYLVLYVEYIFSLIYTGFIFNYNDINNISLIEEFSKTIGILLLFVISNYLVGSIRDGEGKFRDVYTGTIYSFVPLIFFLPIVVIVSNYLTINEVFIYQSFNTILWGWSLVLLFFMIKEVHNYDVKDTIKNILITLFTMFMILASLFIFYILIQQIITFINDVILEVKSHG